MLMLYHPRPIAWIYFLTISSFHHEKEDEREAFSDWNGCCKGVRGDSEAYGERRLPECIFRVALMLKKMHSIAW